MNYIPFKLINLENDSYHIVVSANVNNNKGVLVIDTGASKTVIDENIVNSPSLELLDYKNVVSSGLGGEIKLQLTKLPEIKITNFILSNFVVALIDLSHINKLYQKYHNEPIIGLLGSDFFLKYKANIDYDQKIISLKINE